jgi:peroxiredoxin
VHFWATFCAPCQRSFPAYQQIADAHRGRVAVVGISEDDPDMTKKQDLVAFAKAHGARFLITWDKGRAMAEKYSLRTMPATFVVDREGVVRHVHEGFSDGDVARTAAEVDALLK